MHDGFQIFYFTYVICHYLCYNLHVINLGCTSYRSTKELCENLPKLIILSCSSCPWRIGRKCISLLGRHSASILIGYFTFSLQIHETSKFRFRLLMQIEPNIVWDLAACHKAAMYVSRAASTSCRCTKPIYIACFTV